MKILHILAQLPTRTGSGIYFSSLINGLSEHHEQACVFGYQDDYCFDILDESRQFPLQFKTDSVPFPIAGMSDVMPYENTVYSQMTDDMLRAWQDSFRARVKHAVEESNPDLIISHHLWMLTSMVKEMYPDLKVIGVCHGTDIRQSQKATSLREQHVTNIHELDKVFALSTLQVDEIAKEYEIDKDKITVIGGGFNDKIFYSEDKPRKKSENISIVFIGKIAPAKGVYALIDAFEMLLKEKPNAELSLIGTPDAENQLIISKCLERIPQLKVYNVANQAALGDLLRESDLFVLPSYFEGLGLVAIESLACGVRAVTTEIEGLMSLLGDEINNSGIIEYVPLPRLKNVDEPLEEDLPAFTKNLCQAMLSQIEKIENNVPIDAKIKAEIAKHSWSEIVKKVNANIH